MQQNPAFAAPQTAPTLGSRLAECANKLGGKRALAKAAGLSEAQLFRYINGDCDIALSKLQALAAAAQVAPEWLLTGNAIIAPPSRPEFNPDLLRQITQTIEEYLFEYPVTFGPKHRAELIALAYESLRHDIATHGHAADFSRENVFNMLDFAAALKRTEELTVYHTLISRMSEGKPLSSQEEQTLDRLVRLGWQSIYSGISGQLYYDRMGPTLNPVALHNLLQVVADVTKLVGRPKLDWLDLGCGNGRHLLPLLQHAPHLKPSGMDSSPLAAAAMTSYENNGRLPAGTFQQGHLHNLPYAPNSHDVVFARCIFNHSPLLAERDLGIHRILSECHRVLRVGGVIHITMSPGQGNGWLPFWQYIPPQQFENLLRQAGFTIVTQRPQPTIERYREADLQAQDYAPESSNHHYTVTAQRTQ